MLISSFSDCSRVAVVCADSAAATTEAELRKVDVNSAAVPGVIVLVDCNGGTAEQQSPLLTGYGRTPSTRSPTAVALMLAVAAVGSLWHVLLQLLKLPSTTRAQQ